MTTVEDATGSGSVHEKVGTDISQRGRGAIRRWTLEVGGEPLEVGGEFSYSVQIKIQMLREFQEPGEWRTTVLASWAESTLETYCRHLRHLATAQYATSSEGRIKVLRGYLALRAATDKTWSNMRQIISACRLCEELALVDEFVPKSMWRMVRGKDRLAGRGSSQGWGSPEVLECMAKRASRAEDKIVVALAVLSIILSANLRGSVHTEHRPCTG